ncbi:phage tail protein [Pseudomonas koreensis]|uniref:phage tail assembly chaperone n=1 Tax=Pseudomonas koreensis TaxID=198620 RepID=UPI00123B949F|nr:phage tail assembly chaperone [Pseudomonas koreensis]KAA8739131.1 phage tail protein [Pseudomonas koreensis]
MFASKSERGFYDESIHASMPDDVVEITLENHTALMVGHAKGKEIGWDDQGYPVLIDPPTPSPEFFAEVERSWRDGQLAVTDGVVSRHRDELEEAQKTTLTPAQYSELQAYRRALRNWPETGEFPLTDHRPEAPTWLGEAIN